MEISPDFLGNSIVIVLVSYIIVFIFQIYMMYLNYKQSKVNNQMDILIGEMKSMNNSLHKLLKKK